MAVEHPIVWDDEKVSRLWSYYTRTGVPYFSDLYGSAILKATRLPLSESLDVLDFGSGPGFMWDHLQRLGSGWRYAGMDFSPASVEALSERAKGQRNFNGAMHIQRLPLPAPDNAFDVVLVIEVVEHLDDEKLVSTLTEAARVLKTGGVLVVSTPNDEDLGKQTKLCPECGALFHEWQHVRKWTSQTLAAYIAPFGFKPRNIEALDFGASKPLGWAASMARGIVKGHRERPHLLATFTRA